MSRHGQRARPTPQLLEAQAGAKARWRQEMVRRPFREKVAIVLEMQRQLYPVVRQRRALQWWERPWEIEP